MSASDNQTPGETSARAAVQRNRAIVFLALAAFASAATTRICDALLPLLAQDFRVSVGEAAIVIAAYSATYGLLQPAFGFFGDRIGKYQMALASCVLTLAATLACAWALSLNGLTFARLAAGASAAGIVPLALAWIGDVTPYAERQTAIARYMSGQVLGLISGLAIGGIIGEHLGWRAAFFAIAAVYAFAIIGLWLQLRTNPATRAQARSDAGNGFVLAMKTIFGRADARAVLIAVFAEGFFCFGALAYVTAMLRDRFGLGFGAAGLTLAAFGLAGLVYSLLARRIIARLGEKGVVLAGGALFFVAFAILAVSPYALLAPLGCFLVGAGFYSLHNVLQVNATQLAPQARATGVGIFATCLFIGQAAGAAAAAPLFDRAGATPIFAISAVALPLLALYIAAKVAGRSAGP